MNQRMLQRLVVMIALACLLFPCFAVAQHGRLAGLGSHGVTSTVSRDEGERGMPWSLWDFFAGWFGDRAASGSEEGDKVSPRESRKSLLDVLNPWCIPNPFDNRGTIDPDGNP